MSNHTYTVIMQTNSADVSQIIRDDGAPVGWSDSDFQNWNSAQQIPVQLSPVQDQIRQARQATFTQFQTWYAGLTAQQQLRLLYELMQRALRSEIV